MAGAAFRDQQRQVAIRMAAAVVVTVAAIGVGLLRPGPALPVLARLQLAVRIDLFVLFWLALAIGNVARLRFGSADDIGGSAAGTASPRVATAVAFLQNTLKQVALAVPAHLALALASPRPTTLLALLATLFALGRLLFLRGYAGGAASRAFGFALTFYPGVAAMLLAIALGTFG